MKNINTKTTFAGLFAVLLAVLPTLSWGAEAKLDSGDTAWMLTATALVLFMTIPGLSLFYAGMVRSKNVLSIMMQCFAITGLMSILWVAFGYSMAFDTAGMIKDTTNFQSFVGGFTRAFLAMPPAEAGAKAIALKDSLSGSIPETVFITFQMTFAIITPALMVGAFAERIKFSSLLVFTALWLPLVYAPICHMAWSGDGSFFGDMGVKDFAGGTVVHINAGIAGFVAALVLGKRKGYPKTAMPPHNLTLTVVGAGMLWVGWFGFNAGSALTAGSDAGMAMLVTQVATAAAALTWMFSEWISHGKPSVLGIATGAIAGLVAITPASGYVGPMGAMAIGLIAGVGCFVASTTIKRALGYDDSLDVFGVHAIGGIIGAILTGVFIGSLGGVGLDEGVSMGQQVWIQTKAVAITVAYVGVVSFILLKLIDLVMGLRISEDQETEGLDLASHDERGYII
ncbi:MAG TPA: ammonium transporter [Acidiferrobacteraceae bacterium]|nr:ammonium transporter [Acidiferrobacteraceae bacterium]HEX20440.1 ammonium transporter [Acidiferrobacteraceae bacterium]